MREAARIGGPRAKAIARKELESPPLPRWGLHLLGWLGELHGRSGVLPMGGGFLPLSYETVVAWQAAKRITPSQDELDALMELDAVWCQCEATAHEQTQPRKPLPHEQERQ